MPPQIQEVLPGGRWSLQRMWALENPSYRVPLSQFTWRLERPIWRLAGERFQLSPARVMHEPELHPEHHARILAAELSYPLCVMRWEGRLLILDG